MRPSRIVHRSTPSTSIERPVGANPGGSIGAGHRSAHPPAPGDLIALRGAVRGVGLVEAQIGEADPAPAHELLDGGDPAGGRGSAGSSQTMSSVSRSAMAPASWSFQAAM